MNLNLTATEGVVHTYAANVHQVRHVRMPLPGHAANWGCLDEYLIRENKEYRRLLVMLSTRLF